MVGCARASHPTMSQRMGRLARLKGSLPPGYARAWPAPAAPRPGGRAREAMDEVREASVSGELGRLIYHPKGVAHDTSRKGGLGRNSIPGSTTLLRHRPTRAHDVSACPEHQRGCTSG